MVIQLYGEGGQKELRFYIHENELIYASEWTANYKVPIYDTTYAPGTIKDEERHVFLFNAKNWSDEHDAFVEAFDYYLKLSKQAP